MGAMIERPSTRVRRAEEPRLALAKSVMEADHHIDQKERNIESMCLRLLLNQQPSPATCARSARR